MNKLLIALLFFIPYAVEATQCIAHRGDKESCLENSFICVKRALDKEAAAVEFDVRHTRDGVGILMHDKDMDKVAKSRIGKRCPLNKSVSRIYFKQIQRNCILKDGQEITTLEEVLPLFANSLSLAIIEFKDKPSVATKRIIREEFAGRPNDLRLISFNAEILRSFHTGPGRSFYKDVNRWFLSSKPKDRGLEFEGVGFKKWKPGQVAYFKDQGLEVMAWTYSTRNSITHMAPQDLDFIATDTLSLCKLIVE